jgi:hypothetical protein
VRKSAREFIVRQVEELERAQRAEGGGEGTGDGVVMKIEKGERGEFGDGRGERQRQLIGRELNLFQFEAIEKLIDPSGEPERGGEEKRERGQVKRQREREGQGER